MAVAESPHRFAWPDDPSKKTSSTAQQQECRFLEATLKKGRRFFFLQGGVFIWQARSFFIKARRNYSCHKGEKLQYKTDFKAQEKYNFRLNSSFFFFSKPFHSKSTGATLPQKSNLFLCYQLRPPISFLYISFFIRVEDKLNSVTFFTLFLWFLPQRLNFWVQRFPLYERRWEETRPYYSSEAPFSLFKDNSNPCT